MKKVNVTINHCSYCIPEGKTILQAVHEYGIDEIPTLCYEESLGHINSCYLCVVEVEGARNLLPACSTQITQGMKIHTRSEEVIQARKQCLQLLMSDHYADCLSPCHFACPAGIDIQGYLALAAQGLNEAAVALIKEKNPLPIVCGRVCVKPCELKCRRELVDQPVAIDNVKRGVSESEDGKQAFSPKAAVSDKKAAVIGAGPAGLSFAYYMALKGHQVTVFEQMDQAGGMLRYGIPAYRMPDELLDFEIGEIAKLGVNFRMNHKITTYEQVDALISEYDNVFLGFGAWQASEMGAQGEEGNVLSGLDFLRNVRTGEIKQLNGRVLIIGGGNTAIDASRTALRLGADEAVIIYRRQEAEMPAHKEEIEAAKEEGVKFVFQSAPTKVVCNDNEKSLCCIKMALGEPDESGRRRPQPIENSEYFEQANTIIAAIGQYTDIDFLKGHPEINVDGKGRIRTDETTRVCAHVYAGGDVVTGPDTVIAAIASGRKAAEKAHAETFSQSVPTADFHITLENFSKVEILSEIRSEQQRTAMPHRNANQRANDFKEVETGYSPEQVMQEANRCLSCGCNAHDLCLLRKYCSEYAVESHQYSGAYNKMTIDTSHPYIVLDPNKCIKCGRCIKTCENVAGKSVLGLKNRGFKAAIAVELDRPLAEVNCYGCGNCIDSCPTGAITAKDSYFPITQAKSEWESLCTYCSAFCPIRIRKYADFVEITSNRDKQTGKGEYICGYGRQGMRKFFSPDRITAPQFTNTQGEKVQISWNDALRTAAQEILQTIKTSGKDSVGILLSSALSLEEIRQAVSFGQNVIGTKNIALINNSNPDCHRTTEHMLFPPEQAHTLIFLGDEAGHILPELNWRIRELRKSRAVQIVTVGNYTPFLEDIADIVIKEEGFPQEQLLQIISQSEKPLIFCEGRYSSYFAVLQQAIEGEGAVIPLTHIPHAAAFMQELPKQCGNIKDVKLAIFIGDEPYGYENTQLSPQFSIFIHFLPVQSPTANIVFPASILAETGGTYITYSGKQVKTKAVMKQRTEKSNCEILHELANQMKTGGA